MCKNCCVFWIGQTFHYSHGILRMLSNAKEKRVTPVQLSVTPCAGITNLSTAMCEHQRTFSTIHLMWSLDTGQWNKPVLSSQIAHRYVKMNMICHYYQWSGKTECNLLQTKTCQKQALKRTLLWLINQALLAFLSLLSFFAFFWEPVFAQHQITGSHKYMT